MCDSLKKCNRCGEFKPKDSFYRSKKNYEQLRGDCKDCEGIRILRRKQNKKITLIKNCGGKCVDCQIEINDRNPSIFEFHHTDPTQKEFSDFANKSSKIVDEELKKCVLLCANCHKMRHKVGYDEINYSKTPKPIPVNIRVGVLRFKRKDWIIKQMGSKCVKCGLEYNISNYPIFECHHTDPTQKDFADFANKSNKIIREEIDKCVLLCSNCHKMEHAKY